jgi:GAF domain-containing protein
VTAALLPETVFHFVVRTRESVILDAAAAQPLFAADPYLRQRQSRSVLCLPLVKQSKLIGVLYLENNLASHVFTPTRISVLELLASKRQSRWRTPACITISMNVKPGSGAWSSRISSGS